LAALLAGLGSDQSSGPGEEKGDGCGGGSREGKLASCHLGELFEDLSSGNFEVSVGDSSGRFQVIDTVGCGGQSES
jgi:hypothetical protein